MAYETVVAEKRDGIGFITLNRPKSLNTFNLTLAKELNDALTSFDGDDEVLVVVVKGEGKSFCAGIDVTEMEGKSALEMLEWVTWMDKHNHTIARMDKVVVAQVQGYAVANGAGLVHACDLAVASEDAMIGTTAINIGLFCLGPGFALRRSVGRKKALELLFCGEMINSKEAARLGLVNRVVPLSDLEEETLKFVKNLAKKSPLALKTGKRALYTSEDMDYLWGLDYGSEVFTGLCLTEDAKEGVDAFLNKRKPTWKGK